jgi:hypothetical protein
MEESKGEQCIIVFVLIVTEPASGRWGVWTVESLIPPAPQLAGSATIYAKTTVDCSPDSSCMV